MTELQLARSADDRQLYELAGIGTLRMVGTLAPSGLAQAGERAWQITWRGIFRNIIRACDESGQLVGEWQAFRLQRNGPLHWSGRVLTLRSEAAVRNRWALLDGERRLATFGGKGWGARQMAVTIDDDDDDDAAALAEPGLVLSSASTLPRRTHLGVIVCLQGERATEAVRFSYLHWEPEGCEGGRAALHRVRRTPEEDAARLDGAFVSPPLGDEGEPAVVRVSG